MTLGRRVRRALWVLAFCAVFTPPPDARADWLMTPFAASSFGSATTFLDPELALDVSHLLIGASGGWLSDGIIGVEGEFAFAPNFFERGDRRLRLVLGSRVTALSGSLIAAVPLSVTQYSLRPYAIGGLGMLHASYEEVVSIVPVNETMPAVHFGAGAIGFLSPRTGVRFDVRHVRSLSRGTDVVTGDRSSKLAFWRAAVGVVIRYR